MIELKGKSALITGGSRGIGAAAAILLARAGAKVAITYTVHREKALAVKRDIEKKGGDCWIVRTDALSEKQIKRAVKEVAGRFGTIDILVNNAGIWKKAPIRRMTTSQWDETLSINLRSVFLFTREVIPHMKPRGGKIINVSSTAGQRGEASYSHYAASKAGIIAFTKSIAVELAPLNIAVNSIAPGWVDTDMTSAALRPGPARKQIERLIPRTRVATPREIAGPILFLASDLSDHLIGATISVNGGSVMVT